MAILNCIQFIQFNLDYLSWIYWSIENQISVSDKLKMKLKLLLNLGARGDGKYRKVIQEVQDLQEVQEGGRARSDRRVRDWSKGESLFEVEKCARRCKMD